MNWKIIPASLGIVLAHLACAEEAVPEATTLTDGYHLAADTEVHLRLLESVASNTHQHGDRFRLEVVDPIVVDGVAVVPAGALGEGQVVHASKGGFGGRAGELILASRFIRVGDQTVKLRSFAAGSGEDRVNLAMGLSFVFVGVFVTGKDISLPAGTDVQAKIAEDTVVFSLGPNAEAVIDASLPVPESSPREISKDEFSRE